MYKKKARPAKKYHKRAKVYRRPRNVNDYAGLSETTTLGTLNTNTMYQKRDFTLAGSPRAAAVATAYQHYRIKKIELVFKPQIDTFVGGGGFALPQLFWMIDKSGSIPANSTLGALKSMGAKPKRLDDRNVRIAWRLSVLTSTIDGTSSATISQYRISPWLSTNNNALQVGAFVASTVDHLGMFWYAETAGNQLSYTVDVTIHYQFKKPLNTTLEQGQVEAIKV